MNVYGGRGPRGNFLGVARSRDIFDWRSEPNNPVTPKPAWTDSFGGSDSDWQRTFSPMKDPDLLFFDDVWFLYHVTRDGESGAPCIAAFSTRDFTVCEDLGPV